MYEIKINGEILHQNNAKSEYRLSAGIMSEEVNQIPVFNFTIPAVNPHFCDELHDRLDMIELKNTLLGEIKVNLIERIGGRGANRSVPSVTS